MKKGLYIVLALFLLSCGVMTFYAFRPEIAGAVDGLMRSGRGETAAGNLRETEETAGETQARESETESASNNESDMAAETGEAVGEDEGDLLAKDPGVDGLEYQPPSPSSSKSSAQVSGRNGYEPVRGESVRVGEEDLSQLGTGPTGDGLTFDSEWYPYYAMLDETGQHLYRQMYANVNAFNASFKPVEEVSADQLKHVFSAVYNDHPELFWLDTAYSCKYIENGPCVEVDLSFNRTAQDPDGAKAAFDAGADAIVAQAQGLPNDYEKEKYVYNALIDRVDYDLGAEMNQSAYSALVNGRSVCAGYARAFQYLMRRLNIPCYYCTGYAGEDHAWNIVRLDDGYYNVDPTWGDVEGSRYAFFNKSDADYADTHVRQELSVYLPACDGQAYRDLDSDFKRPEEAGLSEDQIFGDMQGYYENCYNQITGTGLGDYTFYNALEGEQLLDEWYQAYQAEAYKQAYMEDAMTAVGASSCQISLEIEELQGKRFLITHKVSIH